MALPWPLNQLHQSGGTGQKLVEVQFNNKKAILLSTNYFFKCLTGDVKQVMKALYQYSDANSKDL